MKFYWSALVITTIAFTFSLFANPTTNDNSNNIPLDTTAHNVHSDNPIDNTGDKWVDRSINVEKQVWWSDKPVSRITQTEDEHVKQGNGSMYAIDLVTDSGDAYFPSKHTEYFIYFIWEDSRIGNYIIIRHDKERWVYWHTVTSRSKWEYVQSTRTNNVLWQANKSWLSTAKHIHIERWICPDKQSKMKECNNVSSTWQVAPRNKELKEQRGWVLLIWDNKDNMKSASVIKETNKEGTRWDRKTKPSNEIKVIACLNEKDMTIHETKQGTCFLWKGWKWKNIMIPPQKDIDMFKKVFGDDYKYRLAIANFEGSFREDNGNTYAHWYLQTLRSYKIPPDIESQLNWLAKREIGTTGRICDLNDMNKTKLDRYTCMAWGHFGFFKPGDKHYPHSVMYKKRYRAATEYYLSLDF